MEQMAAAQLRLIAIGRRHEMMAAFHSVPRDQWLETLGHSWACRRHHSWTSSRDGFCSLPICSIGWSASQTIPRSSTTSPCSSLVPCVQVRDTLSNLQTGDAGGDGGVGGQKGKRVDSKWSLSYSEGWHRPYFSRRIGLLSCTRIGSPLHACIEWGYPAPLGDLIFEFEPIETELFCRTHLKFESAVVSLSCFPVAVGAAFLTEMQTGNEK